MTVRLHKASSMDWDCEGASDSDLDDDYDPIVHNQNSIKMYKFLPSPNLKLKGKSSTLNPIDKASKSDRVSRGNAYPLGRPRAPDGNDTNWDFFAYRFKLSDVTPKDRNVSSDADLYRVNRASTSTGRSRLTDMGTSLEFGHDVFSRNNSHRCLPPLGSNNGVTFDPDNTVSPAMLRDILESEGISKTNINHVVRDQAEKRATSFMVEEHYRRLAEPAPLSRLKLPNEDCRKKADKCDSLKCGKDAVSTARLSPILPPRPRLTPPSPRLNRSKSVEESTEDVCGHRDLGTWRSDREHRLRPWAADPSPKQSPRGSRSDLEQIGLEYGEKTKDKLDSYSLEIERTKWLTEFQLERTFYRKGALLPRIILVSSKVSKASQIEKVIKQEKHLLYVPYDYDLSTFDEILGKVKAALQGYRSGSKAKSILLICQGGPGYLYLLRKRVLTPQKLSNPANRDVINFWCSLADCLTRMDPDGAAIHILGCCVIGNKQGEELMAQLQKFVRENKIVVDNPLEISVKGHEIIETYFDIRRYKIWRASQNTSVESIKFDSFDGGGEPEKSSKLPPLNPDDLSSPETKSTFVT